MGANQFCVWPDTSLIGSRALIVRYPNPPSHPGQETLKQEGKLRTLKDERRRKILKEKAFLIFFSVNLNYMYPFKTLRKQLL